MRWILRKTKSHALDESCGSPASATIDQLSQLQPNSLGGKAKSIVGRKNDLPILITLAKTMMTLYISPW